MKALVNLFEWVTFAILIVVAGVLILANLSTPFKFKIFAVTSGSMKPTIGVGSVVISVPQGDYKTGEIVSFWDELGTGTVTHRIIEVNLSSSGKIYYKTKGDANEDPDINIVSSKDVVGKVLFNIPLLGYLLVFAKTRLGFFLLVAIPTSEIIIGELLNIKKEVSSSVLKRKQKLSKESVNEIF